MKQAYASTLLSLLVAGCAVTPAAQRGHERPDPRLHPEMIRIEGGTFFMGSPVKDPAAFEYHEDERPQREVAVETFYISRFLVTAEDFCVFLNDVGNNGYGRFRMGDTVQLVDGRYVAGRYAERCPATAVNWNGARAYCRWLSQRTGRRYRLPSEAEWEYAARGSEGREFPWGEQPPPEFKARRQASYQKEPFYRKYGQSWIYNPYDPSAPWIRSPVGSFPMNATPDGVYDMLAYGGYYGGQWCRDRYTDATSEEHEPMRVVRGCHERRGNAAAIRKLRKQKGLLEEIYNLVGETSINEEHDGRTWTRVGRFERSHYALIRLVSEEP